MATGINKHRSHTLTTPVTTELKTIKTIQKIKEIRTTITTSTTVTTRRFPWKITKKSKKTISPELKQKLLEEITPRLDQFIKAHKTLEKTSASVVLDEFLNSKKSKTEAIRPELLAHILTQKGNIELKKKLVEIKNYDLGSKKNLADHLRTFEPYANGDNKPLLINNTLHTAPNLSSYKKESEKRLRIVTWLIQSLDDACQEFSPLSAEEQAIIFCNKPKDDVSDEIKEKLKELIETYPTDKQSSLDLFLEELKNFELPEFSLWAETELEKCLENKDVSLTTIIRAFLDHRWREDCQKSIPCFPILNLINIDVFSGGVRPILEKQFCPQLNNNTPHLTSDAPEENKNTLRLTSPAGNDASFEIEYKKTAKLTAFSVTQVKRFEFITQERVKSSHGSVEIHWKIRSRKKTEATEWNRTANLWATDLQLTSITEEMVPLIEEFFTPLQKDAT